MNSKFIFKDIFSALFKMAGVFGVIVFILIILFVSIMIFKGQKSSTKVIMNAKYNEKIELIANTKGFLRSSRNFKIIIYDKHNIVSKKVIISCPGMVISLPYKLENDSLFILVNSHMNYEVESNSDSRTTLFMNNLNLLPVTENEYVEKNNYLIFP
jgi:hypothetical protein